MGLEIKCLTYIVKMLYIKDILFMSKINPKDWDDYREDRKRQKRLKKRKKRKEVNKKRRKEKYVKKYN